MFFFAAKKSKKNQRRTQSNAFSASGIRIPAFHANHYSKERDLSRTWSDKRGKNYKFLKFVSAKGLRKEQSLKLETKVSNENAD